MLDSFASFLATADDAARIVGGKDAAPGQFPYMASLRVNKRHICGGAILDATHILTAAHCIKGKSKDGFTVVTGTNSRTQGGNSHRVADMYIAPGYESDPDKDIGVIKVRVFIKTVNIALVYSRYNSNYTPCLLYRSSEIANVQFSSSHRNRDDI